MRRSVFFLFTLLALFARESWSIPLDQMGYEQAAAATSTGTSDSTILRPPRGKEAWTSRTFTAEASSFCDARQAGGVGIGSTSRGALSVSAQNSRGQIDITWKFERPVTLRELNPSKLSIDLAQSSKGSFALDVRASLETSKGSVSISHQGVTASAKDPQGLKTLTFHFYEAAPRLFQDQTTRVTALKLTAEMKRTCDAFFDVRGVRIEQNNKKAKQRLRPPTAEDESPAGTPSPTPSAEPTPDPCAGESIKEEIAACEKKANEEAGGCAEYKCSCQQTSSPPGYYISSHYAWLESESPVGKPCVLHACGGIKGICSTFGKCFPAQFADFTHPLFAFDGGISFKFPAADKVDLDCFDSKRQPTPRELCSMTPQRAVDAMFATVTVGKPCEGVDGVPSICVAGGECKPDPTVATYCIGKPDCSTACGAPGSFCWRGECLTYEQATFKVCEKQSYYGSRHRGICGPCMAFFNVTYHRKEKPEKDNGLYSTCNVSTISRDPSLHRDQDPPLILMDGATCSRDYGKSKGSCQGGQCVPYPTVTPGAK
jgi:hypothetical protein